MRKPTIWVLTRSDTNQAVQLQKMVSGWKAWIKRVEEFYYCVAKTKALISFSVTAKLICAFVFAYADCWFSHAAAQLILCSNMLNSKYETVISLTSHIKLDKTAVSETFMCGKIVVFTDLLDED